MCQYVETKDGVYSVIEKAFKRFMYKRNFTNWQSKNRISKKKMVKIS